MKPHDLIQLGRNVFLFPDYPPYQIHYTGYKDRTEQINFQDKKDLLRWINILKLFKDYLDVTQRDRNGRRPNPEISAKDVLPGVQYERQNM